MFQWLQPAAEPVLKGFEQREVVFAANQPQYNPLRALVGVVEIADVPAKVVWSRWTLTPEQRADLVMGGDIFLELTTFGRPLQPIRMAVGDGDMPANVLALFQQGG